MWVRVYLDILCESVKHLFCYLDCFGEVPLPLLIDHVFPRVVPIEIADGLLEERPRGKAQCEAKADLFSSEIYNRKSFYITDWEVNKNNIRTAERIKPEVIKLK